MRRIPLFCVALLTLITTMPTRAHVELPPLFADHMVLQRGMQAPIWGTAHANQKVDVSVNGQTISTRADANGEWTARLPELPAGGPYEITIAPEGNPAVVLRDVLVGDVWICSGQSNMEWPLLRTIDAEDEIARADAPQVRLYQFPQTVSVEPTKEVRGEWMTCTPETARNFSAVGYYFGREINRTQNVPVGLISNPWGGMPAEAYTSRETLAADPDFRPILARKEAPQPERDRLLTEHSRKAKAWEAEYLEPSADAAAYATADYDDRAWSTMRIPQFWEATGLNLDGVVWFRKSFSLSEVPSGDVTLTLGAIDDYDTTYVNGQRIGSIGPSTPSAYNTPRKYTIPAGMLKAGRNVLAVRVVDTGGEGGFAGPASQLRMKSADGAELGVTLPGDWQYKIEREFKPGDVSPAPIAPPGPNAPEQASNLFNGMVLPIIPYGIKGAIWYQGESNAGRAEQYRRLFPAMIRDWRQHWGQGDFPFLFVQLANYMPAAPEPRESAWAELREAQLMTLDVVPNTAMAVITDIGEANDIHPRNKKDVGHRLALAARRFVYGEANVVGSGPIYRSMRIEGDKVHLGFDHTGGGLIAKGGGQVKGFAIAGEDRKFVWADATIEGDEIVVSSPKVKNPVAVRYAWADNPDTANLYNKEGLPASPFRTDDWPGVTAGAK